MTTFTFDQVEAAADALVKEVGEGYVYEREYGAGTGEAVCVYVEGEGEAAAPSCAVGRILFTLGVPLSVLQEMDDARGLDPEAGRRGSIAREHILAEAGYTLDEKSRHYLATFQGCQDRSVTYGKARQAAEDAAESV